MTNSQKEPNDDDILSLASIIRKVDGSHKLGASALAEAILSHKNFSNMHHPVSVFNRPWENDGWCDENGRCWLRRRYEPDVPNWRLVAPASLFDDVITLYYSESLPANAIPF